MSDPAALNRIRWRCRRGMLELDAWLARFLDRHLDAMCPATLVLFEELLATEDDDLYGWLTGRNEAPARYGALVAQIKSTKVSP